MNTEFYCENLKDNELERPRCRLEDSIRIGMQEMRWKCVDRINVSQDMAGWRATVNAVMNIPVHLMRGIS
jgi:hypothetical protein